MYAHVSPVTPEHDVGELVSVSPVLQLLAIHVPPIKEPSMPQTCAPDVAYPTLQVNEQLCPVIPLHVVGEFAIVSPVVQLLAAHCPPENDPLARQT